MYRWAVRLTTWVCAPLLVACGVAMLITQAAAAADASSYQSAPRCAPAPAPTANCIARTPLTVVDRSRDGGSADALDLALALPDGTPTTVAVVGSNAAALWQDAVPGTRAFGLLWRGQVIGVTVGNQRTATDRDPQYASASTTAAGIACLLLGIAIVAVHLWGRWRRSVEAPGEASRGGGVNRPTLG